MRNMSFIHTQDQIRNGTKTETTRAGWSFLKPGDIVMAVVKSQGIPKGGKVEKIRPIRIVNNEKIQCHEDCYTYANMKAEGFEGMPPIYFVKHILVKKCGCEYDQDLNRITFEYVEDTNEHN